MVGDLFGDGSSEEEADQIKGLLNGSLIVPLPTYFSVGNRPLPQPVIEKLEIADEVCPNLIFLGRKGTMKTSEGIRIACLGGKVMADSSSADSGSVNKYSPYYTPVASAIQTIARPAEALPPDSWKAELAAGTCFAGHE